MATATTIALGVEQRDSFDLSTLSTVPLHTLCANCTAFCQEWEVLDWFRNPVALCSNSWPYSFFICTVAHLTQLHEHCHLCKLLLAALDRWPFARREDVLDMNVYLHPIDRGKDMLSVHALFSDERPKNDETGRLFACFTLKGFSGAFSFTYVGSHEEEVLIGNRHRARRLP
jgi:hypothetical protein